MGLIVSVVFWSIWLERNNRILDESMKSLEEVCDKISGARW